jgi:PBP1b-binding outer membrane lipoprotein LpoB
MKRASRLSAAVLGAFLIAGCAARGVHIADLQNRPDKYENKTISVNGVVTSSYGVPLVPFQMYKVDDGSGEITVISRGARAPRKGSRVEVKGRVNEIGTFGGQSVGLHIQETDRKVKS